MAHIAAQYLRDGGQFDTGHIPALQDIMRETLNWLDQYLGPVDK